MYLKVRNKNLDVMYPLLLDRFPVLKDEDKQTGNVLYAINISSLQELMELDSLARLTNTSYLGVKLSGTELTLLETAYEFERDL